MAMNALALTQLMIGNCYSKGLRGTEIPSFCKAFSEGFIEGFIAAHDVISQDIGLANLGIGRGKISGILAPPIVSMAYSLLLAQKIYGIYAQSLLQAIASACATHIMTNAEIKTYHLGVAQGTGIGKVIGMNPDVMRLAIRSKMAAKRYNGIALDPFLRAITISLCTNIMSLSIGNITIMGSPILILGVPVPSTGLGKGKIK